MDETMRLVEFMLLAGTSLFVIVDPVGAVPAFLAMTPHDTSERRRRTAALACGIMAAVLMAFAIGGSWIFRLLGITLPAFQLAGSLVLLLIALDMLRAQRSRVREAPEDTDAGLSKDEIAVAPLAIPMLAGPGAISTAILLRGEARTWGEQIGLCLCIVGVAAITFLILRFAAHGGQWLSPVVTRIATRIMGLLLAAVAFQFMANAVKALRLAGP
jgi:multiple antibiotic resistance protein